MKVGDTVVITNPAACIHGCNPAMQNLKGQTRTITAIDGNGITLNGSIYTWCTKSLEFLNSCKDKYILIVKDSSHSLQYSLNTYIDNGYEISSAPYKIPADKYGILLVKTDKSEIS